MVKLWEAQGKHCSICGKKMVAASFAGPRGWTVDHVYNQASKRFHAEGNKLIAHSDCNSRKGSREPTGCEVILLYAANARLGHDLTPRNLRSPRRSRPYAAARVVYTDKVKTISPLALAFERAGVAP